MLDVLNSGFPTTLLFDHLPTGSEAQKLLSVAINVLRWWKTTEGGCGLNAAIMDWNS